jgi:hypothetical protein
MADEQELNQLFRFRPWPPGDPFVLVDTILRELEGNQRKQALGLYLDSVASTLQVNLKLVEGLRQLAGGQSSR